MEDLRPVFVLITAKTCHACHGFKKRTWDDLRRELEKRGKVKIVTIEVPTTQSKPDPKKYPKDLSRFIGWFPTMSLFPADRWNNPNSELIGIIKNGKIVPPGNDKNGKFVPERVEAIGQVNLSKDDILKWVDYTLTKDRIFNRKQGSESGKSQHHPNIMLTDNGKVINGRFPDGKFMVPTASYYAKFQPSRVE